MNTWYICANFKVMMVLDSALCPLSYGVLLVRILGAGCYQFFLSAVPACPQVPPEAQINTYSEPVPCQGLARLLANLLLDAQENGTSLGSALRRLSLDACQGFRGFGDGQGFLVFLSDL